MTIGSVSTSNASISVTVSNGSIIFGYNQPEPFFGFFGPYYGTSHVYIQPYLSPEEEKALAQAYLMAVGATLVAAASVAAVNGVVSLVSHLAKSCKKNPSKKAVFASGVAIGAVAAAAITSATSSNSDSV